MKTHLVAFPLSKWFNNLIPNPCNVSVSSHRIKGKVAFNDPLMNNSMVVLSYMFNNNLLSVENFFFLISDIAPSPRSKVIS